MPNGLCTNCHIEPKAKSQSRCLACSREYQRAWNRSRGVKPFKPAPSHGQRGYVKGCRCETCTRAAGFQWPRYEGRKALLRRLKSEPCTDCGNSYPYYVMEYDHVRGQKKFNLSNHKAIAMTKEQFLEEIAKCDLVCANCHRYRTHARASSNS